MIKIFAMTCCIISIVSIVGTTHSAHSAPKPSTLGWIEKVSVGKKPFVMKAKMDTGAGTTSLHAEIIKTYKKDDKDYVLYRITDKDGNTKTIRSIIRRQAKIKKKVGGTVLRPVVRLDMCVGDLHINEEVNLTDRSHMNYPLLIGRNMLAKHFMIDPAQTFTTAPSCE